MDSTLVAITYLREPNFQATVDSRIHLGDEPQWV